jgi:hypothetical protein
MEHLRVVGLRLPDDGRQRNRLLQLDKGRRRALPLQPCRRGLCVRLEQTPQGTRQNKCT